MFFQRRFDEIFVLVGLAVRHALAELFVGHLADGDGALGKTYAVAARGAGDVVGQFERAARAGGGAFLADRDVRWAAVVEIANRLVGAGTQLDDHLFEFADDKHVFQNRDGLVGGDRFVFEFGLQITGVTVGRDFAAVDFERREFRP